MSYWLNRKLGTLWRPRTWGFLFGGFTFFLLFATLFSISFASHSTTTWDFSTAGDYTYDSSKIEVVSDVGRLKKNFSERHDTQAKFDTGSYTGGSVATIYNTGAPAAGVKLTPGFSASIATPATGIYTSPVIAAGVGGTNTIWESLEWTQFLEASSASFGFPAGRLSISTAAGTIREPSARDLNQDGAADVVAADRAGGELYWYKNS